MNVKIFLNLFWLNIFLYEYKVKLVNSEIVIKKNGRSKIKRIFILIVVIWFKFYIYII